MMFDAINEDALYDALVARDGQYEGRYFVGVTSTGIFCRLTCPARKPLRENCQFFPTIGQCIEAGFRPCKRCSPLGPAAEADPMIANLLTALHAAPDHRWSEGDVITRGFDPSTVRRAFKRQFGVTFLEMARLNRLRDGFLALKDGQSVIQAQLEAGFDSGSGFRTAFAKLLGVAPGSFTGKEHLRADLVETPVGPMVAVADMTSLHLLEFMDRKGLPAELKKLRDGAKGQLGLGRFTPIDQVTEQLEGFFDGRRPRFDVPLTMHGTPFTRRVWSALREIPAGQTRSYGDIAKAIGQPTATRAVARANGANQIAILIPCHRVIGADGSLTGYAGGLWRKQKLIELERHYAGASA
ncbi:trifunctional transcriptional activator/DNA repair protein Ada/methylated-DNA--[protein]-cysteine S-methyltransferase [Parvularcula sp. LCG005]|uniref:bifunctional transcriptional activator/DNA repair enzyme AdaA n=1 Tax=Parvularcula sp. LCG005 TaxID=3078805 RepID=UPI002942A428|nr:trifunctional transcriptional activator/DNA repair protein Ada/methylated-DNA--[protein]-cysteine S-methyltransferase [Parvularcula sp. LCG005]WOI54506.1 trifunctional transcriptional activator/DNA repair protein Ada/methylated-DNA--[protein]-cysteine S-methyltransferase [Parvularcula sp. LCG005]